MKITVVGTGYVGLVTGTCLAEFGHHVVCVDKDADKIERLKNGEIPIYEPGLQPLVQNMVASKRLEFTTDLPQAVAQADAVFIAVGTPTTPGSDRADLSAIHEVAREIASALASYTVVITKSTVPAGTSRQIYEIIRKENPGADFDVASNPEFLREGSAIEDFLKPNRVVIGVDAEAARARHILEALYRPLYLIEVPIIFTTIETSELIKYAANGFLALKIAFINEMADICEKTGADVQELARAVGLDERIGSKFLNAGPGFGGSCFPKDLRALRQTALDCGVTAPINQAIIIHNECRKQEMAQRVIAAFNGQISGKTIAVLGVTFKPNTDDMRDAPSLSILPVLQQAGAMLKAYDPVGMTEAAKYLSDINWQPSVEEAVRGADATLILTEWNEFRALSLNDLGALMAYPLVIDFRNIYPLDEIQDVDYISVGRHPVYGARKKYQLKIA